MAERRSVQLDSPPSLNAMYARALAGFGTSTVRRLPVVGHLPGLSVLPGFGTPREDLPNTELVLSEAPIAAAHVHRYQDVCGFERSDRLPLTYPHMLAFPLSMQLMTDPSFPFPVIGMVHIENRIDQHRPLVVSDALEVSAWAQGLREHKRGTQFDVCAEVRAGGELVWESRSTYLHYGASSEGSSKKRSSERRGEDSEAPEPQDRAIWEVPGDIGRRYGEVSGDRNPIHMHPLAARLFGMPRAIAHGMWVKARCLATLEAHEPDAATVQASFKLPLLIPARVEFASHAEAGELQFSVRDADSGKPHLSGHLKPA